MYSAEKPKYAKSFRRGSVLAFSGKHMTMPALKITKEATKYGIAVKQHTSLIA